MRIALILVLSISALGAFAQDGDDAAAELVEEIGLGGETERCISSQSIRRIKAIDDSTIAFYMRNRDVYLNFLQWSCNGLRRNNRIAYETRGGRLCSMDRVSVIYDHGGLDTGIPCPLGVFHVTDQEAADLMVEASEMQGRPSPVTVEAVELPPLEEEATAADDIDPADIDE